MTLDQFAKEFNWCFLCFRTEEQLPGIDRLHIHHIERRSQARAKLKDERVNLFRACRDCHEGPLTTMKHHIQLGAKLVSDPTCATSVDDLLRQWLPIRIVYRPAPERVTAREVLVGVGALMMAVPTMAKVGEISPGWRMVNYENYLAKLEQFKAAHPALFNEG